MITTWKELVETQGWEIGKKYELDAYIGVNYIRHFDSIMIIDKDNALLHYDRYVDWRQEGAVLKNCGGKGEYLYDSYSYGKGDYIFFCNTIEEVISDANYLRSEKDTKNGRKSHEIVSAFDRLNNLLSTCDYDIRSTAANMINTSDNGRFSKVEDFVKSYLEWSFDYDYGCEEDTRTAICNIFRGNLMFHDVEADYIETHIATSQIVSVEVNVKYGDESFVIVHTSDGRMHKISEKSNKEVYNALNILYY